VAVVLTLVQTKQIRINIHKRNNTKNTIQTTQNTVYTSTHNSKTPTLYKTYAYTRPYITKQVKTNTAQGYVAKGQAYFDNTGQQIFFVPQTSIGELISTFYVELRYVNRSFLSGRVSKIQRNLNVQNSTLRAHETSL
jgi:hypothetical protein